ncbi:hypothetical protein LF887_04285 [Chryseobacterium sp. MEBOG06]|uniref:RHS repeat-associated core domain-containing protein n=1 Tax=Chryseobacterium sp. MEBOG06 TaxID=2879938 RepID=UPI0021D46031|nr:RHS repeat-associated core domain-containing protein [Chryseobacterium sp. MEBOG06]UKB86360.1 hypothetical protein LF887_04285 [Chryseobacterium sp. MEBOG06]
MVTKPRYYKYNGKELHEIGMYDYGARMMMPDLGRWGVMDAMSEKYSSLSPYSYAINNPVMVIDPDGNDAMFASGEAAQFAFKMYVATMSTGTGTSGGNIFTGFNFSGFGTDDWIRGLDGKWRYEAGITTLEKAMRMAGITGFAKNGTIFSNVSVDGGSISAYAQLNEGGSITKLGADDLASMNAIVDALPMWLGGTWSTWESQEFPQITNTGGLARTDFDASTWDKFRPGDKLFTLDAGSFIFPSTFPADGSKGVPTWAGRVYAGVWGVDRIRELSDLFVGKKSDNSLNSMSVKVTSLDSIKSTGFTYQKDTTIFYGNKSGDFDRAYKPVQDSSYNRDIRNFNSRVPSQYRIK